MTNPEQNRYNYLSCKEHKWPSHGPGGSYRSIGSTEHEQCNSCLALRVTFKTTISGKPVVEQHIIEPNFSKENNE